MKGHNCRVLGTTVTHVGLRLTASGQQSWPLSVKGGWQRPILSARRLSTRWLISTLPSKDRTLEQAADRYADGDRARLHEVWMSGELTAIYEREAIEGLRRPESTLWRTATNRQFTMHLSAHHRLCWRGTGARRLQVVRPSEAGPKPQGKLKASIHLAVDNSTSRHQPVRGDAAPVRVFPPAPGHSRRPQWHSGLPPRAPRVACAYENP